MDKKTCRIKPEKKLECSLSNTQTNQSLPVNTCEICGRQLRSRKAYAGHMLLAHQKRVGIMAELDTRIAEFGLATQSIEQELNGITKALCYIAAYIDRRENSKEHSGVIAGYLKKTC